MLSFLKNCYGKLRTGTEKFSEIKDRTGPRLKNLDRTHIFFLPLNSCFFLRYDLFYMYSKFYRITIFSKFIFEFKIRIWFNNIGRKILEFPRKNQKNLLDYGKISEDFLQPPCYKCRVCAKSYRYIMTLSWWLNKSHL